MPQADEVLEVQQGVVLGQRVEYHRLASNWCAYTPDLPAIVVGGHSREECERRMTESIPWHLEAEGEEAPPRRHRR
jgi:predicted RNase H-like HicB family nuclease